MEIFSASLQKTGDFFLHAGYMSSPTVELGNGLTLLLGGLFVFGVFMVSNAVVQKPQSRLFLYVAIMAALYWLLGCARPHGAG